MTTQEELRKAIGEFDARPIPLKDLIPLLQRAADALDADAGSQHTQAAPGGQAELTAAQCQLAADVVVYQGIADMAAAALSQADPEFNVRILDAIYNVAGVVDGRVKVAPLPPRITN